MPLVSEVYPAKYLKASILNGRTVKVEIETVTTEVMAGAGDRKLVVYFSGRGQGLVLNKTNANELALCFGDDYDGWRGKTIELYPQQVSYQGRDVDAIRVRPIVADPATGSVDDDIPF